MKASFLFFLLVVSPDALDDDIRLAGFGNGHHLYLIVLNSYDFREGTFTYFALEFGEVV